MDDQAKLLPSRSLLLDLRAPLYQALPVLASCFRLHKSACEFGGTLSEKSQGEPGLGQCLEQGQWLSLSECLAQYQFTSSAVLGVFSSVWWKALPKAVVEAKAIKKGVMKKDSSKNWISFEDQLTEKDWDDLPSANPKTRYFVLAPPRLFAFASSQPDATVLEVGLNRCSMLNSVHS
jgi:hypothetical protein